MQKVEILKPILPDIFVRINELLKEETNSEKVNNESN